MPSRLAVRGCGSPDPSCTPCRRAWCPGHASRTQVEEYKNRATFIHLYGPEPHPVMPGTNFDTGTVRPSYWSVVQQHRSYRDRLEMAASVRELVHPEQVRFEFFCGRAWDGLESGRGRILFANHRKGGGKGPVRWQARWLKPPHPHPHPPQKRDRSMVLFILVPSPNLRGQLSDID